MNNINPPGKIRPTLPHTLQIQNFYKYKDFFRRGYKQTLNFEFKCPEKEPRIAKRQNMATQIRLFKVLKQLKFLNKADLSHFKVSNHLINPSRTLSILKKLSQTPTISIITLCHLSPVLIEQWPKFLPRIRSLKYQLLPSTHFSSNQTKKAPLKNIIYCNKLQSLDIRSPFVNQKFSHYPTSLKHLSIQLDPPSDSSLQNLNRLESIHLTINSTQDLNNLCNSLPKLSHLQEISLEPYGLTNLDLSSHLTQLTSGAESPKKLKLAIYCSLSFSSFGMSQGSNRPHILQTLEKFHSLSHLSLALFISSDFFVGSVLEGIKNQTQLQSLKLEITNQMHFQHHTTLELLCKEISTLNQLQHLKLSFQGNRIPDNHKLGDFLPALNPLFNKPLKIKTFSLKCNQLNPVDVAFSLLDLLDGSKNSLEKIKIDIGSYCFPKKDHNTVISLLNDLVNITKLQLIGISISDKKFLNDFAETILHKKYLRVLEIGVIKSTVSKPAFYLAVESILTKRGLQEFQYCVQDDFMSTLKAKSKTDKRMNLEQVRRKNPSLENMPQYSLLFEDDISGNNW